MRGGIHGPVHDHVILSHRFKTSPCRNYIAGKVDSCRFGNECHFAHGQSDLRTVDPHNRPVLDGMWASCDSEMIPRDTQPSNLTDVTDGDSSPLELASHQQQSVTPPSPHKRATVPQRFKTSLCRNYVVGRQGSCPYGWKCRFAHGEHELRSVTQNEDEHVTSADAIHRHQHRVRTIDGGEANQLEATAQPQLATEPSQLDPRTTQPPVLQPSTYGGGAPWLVPQRSPHSVAPDAMMHHYHATGMPFVSHQHHMHSASVPYMSFPHEMPHYPLSMSYTDSQGTGPSSLSLSRSSYVAANALPVGPSITSPCVGTGGNRGSSILSGTGLSSDFYPPQDPNQLMDSTLHHSVPVGGRLMHLAKATG